MANSKAIGYCICEGLTVEADAKIIKEKNDRVVAEAILQTADEVNRNGRIYKREDLEREISCPRTVELLSTGNMLGHDGHPSSQSLLVQQTIDPTLCSTQFLKFWMDGNNVMGHFRGWYNELGKNLDTALRNGDKPSWSLRALGTIKSTPKGNIVDNLRMVTYDRVVYCSHRSAYTTKIVSESGSVTDDNNSNDSNNNILDESAKSLLVPITNDSVISYIKSESCNLKSMMNNFDVLYESINVINNGKDVQLIDKEGNLFIVNLENYIANEIMNYCYNR